MKVLIDARLYGLENTGLGRYVMNLIDGLINNGKENEYVVLLRKKYYQSLNFPKNWKKVCADFRHYSFAEQFKLPGIIKTEAPDITHFPHFNVPLFFKGKYIVTIHDMLMHRSVGLSATTLPPLQYFIKRLGYRAIFGHAVRKSIKVLVPSRAVGDEIAREYGITPGKITVTYEGIDLKISAKVNINIKKPYFTYIGNAYPHKNLGNLVKAIKILNTKCKQNLASQSPGNQNAILAISSARNIFTQKIENLIKKENAGDFVKLLGFVPDDKLGNLLINSSAFVFPTLSEGFGLPGLEAMGVGTLVLASNIPVLKEVYKNNAIYFDPINPEAMAEVMKKTLEMSESERGKKIREAKEFVKIYSWDKMAKETLKIYAESCDSLRQSK